jgi:hypothetical protein
MPRRPSALALCAPWLALAAGAAAEPDLPPEPQTPIHELRIGVLAHDVDHLWSGFRRESGVDVSAEVVFQRPGLPVLWGRLRPNLGVSISTRGDTSQLYAGGLWEIEGDSGLFFGAGLGAALHDGRLESRTREDQKELGSRVLFRVAFELGYAIARHHRLMASFAHVSNASLADPNQGLDTLGVRYGYRF